MEIYSIRPILAILVSAIAAALILFTNKHKNLRESWTLIAATLKFLIVLSLFPLVTEGKVVVFKFFELLPGVTCSLRVDALGLYFALVSSGLWIVTSIFSIGYMRGLQEHEQTRYFASFALSLSATIGIAFAGDLLTMFAFYELLTIATYPLVAHKETQEAIVAGRKYLVYCLGAASVFLFCIAWTYSQTGTLTFQPGGFLENAADPKTLGLLFILFIYGAGVKSALFPVHAWLPTAMVAPTPVSALLHAVAVVKAGVFGILRIVGFVFGPDLIRDIGMGNVLAFLAGFTILFASMMALAQDNLKRRLAYSTISQLAYIVLGSALLTPSGYVGSMLHLSNHAMMKITLFFCAGVIYVKTHKENISEMRGIGYKLPWTMIAFTVGAIGLSGFPAFSGFISKWYLCKGAIEAKLWGALAIYLGGALLNAAYLVPVVVTAFSRNGQNFKPDESSWTLTKPPVITAILTILFGLIPLLIGWQLELANMAARGIFGG
ncbi:MAG: monovalent cation/H+ antiporter subunit D family protein [Candidatus Omnitrophica bacterium]|nr:monovalent cation/H+ antiporter subunit D family protein [Candidatus Omnitrophota bacterium]